MNIHGFVTAGGRSSRMGRDKAWLELGGRKMIDLIVNQLHRITPQIGIIAGSADYSRLGFPVFSDETPGLGPMEAIKTALINSSAPGVLLVACDLPFVTSELFSELILWSPGYDAVVPLDAEGRLEPLCAVYSIQVREAVTDLLHSGERKVSLLFDMIRTRRVEFDELRHLEGSDLFFTNVNTPEDYAAARKLLNNR